MAERRTASVAVAARAAARARRMEAQRARREREQLIDSLADEHAVALAMAEEVRARAEKQIAVHQGEADQAVVKLLATGERVPAVAELLGLTVAEVRAARRRAVGVAGADDEASADAEDGVTGGEGAGDGDRAAAVEESVPGPAVPGQRAGSEASAAV